MVRLAAALMAVALSGCILDDQVCTLELRWGLEVHVIAADTGADLEAIVVARDGAYSETLEDLGPGRYYGAGERAGTYRLEVSSPGYAPAVIERVEVDDGGCHVETERVEVRLAPAP